MIKDLLKNKKNNLAFTGVFVLFLALIIFLVIKNSPGKGGQEFSAKEKGSLVTSGNFLSPSLRLFDNSDVFLGEKDAEIEIIVYEDLSSYYSAEFNKTIDLIKQDFGDKVVIVFRPYASKMFPLSMTTNLWAQCAMDQGKFFEARSILLEKVEDETLSEEYFSAYAEEVNLDLNSLEQCVKEGRHLAKLEDLRKEAEEFDVYGAPTVFVNKEMVIGARSFEDVISGDGQKLEGMKNIISRNLK